MSESVRNNVQHRRFELAQDGHLAVAYYRFAPGLVIFTHTEVPGELAGKGVGSRLVAGALDEIRRQGLKVAAECPFVAGFIGKHPEYRDLLNKPDDADREHIEALLDEALEETFPASDPTAIHIEDR
jgi:predicted GNAT family acetyltransferase